MGVSRQAFEYQTERLVLRELQPEDAEALCRLDSDENVIRYTGETPFRDEADARRFIEDYDHYDRYGFGRWAVEHREGGGFMGFCGLHRLDGDAGVDLAFRFFREHWASGYATEASRACLQAGFHDFGLGDIIGRAMRENLPSISVLQKLGMRFRRMAEDQGVFWLIYGISAEEFDARDPSH